MSRCRPRSMRWRAARRPAAAPSRPTEHTCRESMLASNNTIVLSALEKRPGLTQIELAKSLGLDKTTLMSQLDKLEKAALITRRSDPHDRRRRVPEITKAGDDLRASVAVASAEAERETLADRA
ncbi:MarR family winged helix-turn-helix transcriptional regulator [Lysinimonas soli]|uniref:MarR family winged helix-turn-helix transcriptional regulator n=1 Tax=Lysinimonas soli TaxID=1074233 RepID=A0ABW0NUR3_9MICO